MNRTRILHPFLLAAFPILALYAHNASQLRPTILLLPVAVVLLFSLIAYVLLSKMGFGREKSGLLLSLFLVLFWFYGHAVRIVRVLHHVLFASSWSLDSTRIAVYVLWSAIFVLGLLILKKTNRDLRAPTRILNVLAISLIGVASIQILWCELREGHASAVRRVQDPLPLQSGPRVQEATPDIYYFVLDGYARFDVLKATYHFDNSCFLNELQSRGFCVLAESRSNYAQTELSLASTLNMDYLQNLLSVAEGESSRRAVDDLINSNRVVAYLRPRGYRVVSFRSGFDPSDLTATDMYLTGGSRAQVPSGMSLADFSLAQAWRLNTFQSILVESTPLPLFLPMIPTPAIKYLDPHEAQRQNILFPFAKLTEVARVPSPKFVFIHVLAPHPPFVFGSNGEALKPDRRFTLFDGSHYMGSIGATPGEYLTGYVGQLRFLNKKVIEGVDVILSNSPRRPVIIIQSDHGPGLHLDWETAEKTDYRERLSNFGAYLVPGARELPYEGMTSVNTFRFVFNQYQNAHLKYLPDRSYFSTWSSPYGFLNVTCQVAPCNEGSPRKEASAESALTISHTHGKRVSVGR